MPITTWPARCRRSSRFRAPAKSFGCRWACVNSANLQFARGPARCREVAVHLALGARWGRAVAQLVTESVILALLGAGLALRLARLLAAVIWGVSTTNMATFAGVPLVLLAAAGLAIYVPARRALKIDPVAALRNE